MKGQQVFLGEMVLKFGLFLAWAVWELISLRLSQTRDREAAAEGARHAEAQHGRHEG